MKMKNPQIAEVGYADVVCDLTHWGHVRFFENCKKYCEYLVVGVNTDEVADANKRLPIIDLRGRFEMVGAIRHVDEVRATNEWECYEMLKTLVAEGYNLKYYFHGDDHIYQNTKSLIESLGGEYVMLPYTKEISSTKIVETILKRHLDNRGKTPLKMKCAEKLRKRFPNVKFYGPAFINEGVEIGEGSSVGQFVVISNDCKIGKNCKIFYFASLSKDVILEDNVFIGPGVRFSNDKYPPTKASQGAHIKEGAVICLNSCIGAGVTIGKRSIVGMGAIVIRDVPDERVVVGNPARVISTRDEYDLKQVDWIRSCNS